MFRTRVPSCGWDIQGGAPTRFRVYPTGICVSEDIVGRFSDAVKGPLGIRIAVPSPGAQSVEKGHSNPADS